MMHRRSERRTATSTLELVIAFGLLVLAASMVGRFVSQVKRGLKERELSARIEWELINDRELIGSWSPDQITRERIEQIPLSKSLANRLTTGRLVAQVSHIEEPIAAEQVTLAIACERGGQTMEPAVLTFWIPSKSVEETE